MTNKKEYAYYCLDCGPNSHIFFEDENAKEGKCSTCGKVWTWIQLRKFKGLMDRRKATHYYEMEELRKSSSLKKE